MTEPLIPVISKVRKAKFIFGGTGPDYVDGTDFACDVKAIKITPAAAKDGDDVELACGTTIAAPITETFTINGTGIQRFDDPEGLQAYCHAHSGEAVHFWIKLNDGGSPVFQGQVTIVKLEEGGDAGTNPGDLSYEFDGIGDYSREYLTTTAAGELTEAQQPELIPA